MVVPKPTIQWIGCHAIGFSPGRGGVLFEAVIEHTTGGGATIGALDNWFLSAQAGVSAHFGIGPGGEIHQYVALTDTAFAHGIVDHSIGTKLVEENGDTSPNQWAIGIEHVDGGIAGTVTAKQLDASQRLTAWLFDAIILPNAPTTGAAVDRDHILGHYQIGSHPACPSWSPQRFSDYVARVRTLIQPAGVPLPPVTDPRIQKAMDDLSAAALGLDDLKSRASDLAARASLQAQSLREAVARLARP